MICRANEKLECIQCKGGALYLVFLSQSIASVNSHSHSDIGNRNRLGLMPSLLIKFLSIFTIQFCPMLQNKHCREHYDYYREN